MIVIRDRFIALNKRDGKGGDISKVCPVHITHKKKILKVVKE